MSTFINNGKTYTVTVPVKAKEWLFRHGEVKSAGKGRMSHAHHALLQAAYDAGQRFSNWGPDKVAVMVTETTDATTGEVVETVTAHRIDGYDANGNIAELAPILYPLTEFAVYELNADGSKGKRRSLREACGNDSVSLLQCTCGAPTIVARDGRGYVPATIVAEVSKPQQGNVWDR